MLDMLLKSMGLNADDLKKEGVEMVAFVRDKLDHIDSSLSDLHQSAMRQESNQIRILAQQQLMIEHMGIAAIPLDVSELREHEFTG